MFVGHALLAFALVALAASRWCGPRRALVLGAVAGAFAAVPDVDMGYALLGLTGAAGGPLALATAFWETGNLVHRAVTHSLLVAPAVALLAGVAARWERSRSRNALTAGVGLATALTAAATLVSGPVGGGVMAVFCVASAGVAVAAARTHAVTPGVTAGLALVGLVTHPFGDLFTGEPPAMLYPLATAPTTELVVLHPDPTLHLLAAFALELGTVWAAVLVWSRLAGRPVLTAADGHAGLGVAYGASALLIPAPTLSLSYPFVFSVLALGLAVAVLRLRVGAGVRRPDLVASALTGLAAVTVAVAAYAVAYLALG